MTRLARLAAPPFLLVSLLLSGPATAADTDGDGVDDSLDNCIDHANASQLDSDGDGCGNACDADYNQDATVGGPDFLTFRGSMGLSASDPGFVAAADHNGDGVVGGPDFLTHRRFDGGVAGPSGDPNRLRSACP